MGSWAAADSQCLEDTAVSDRTLLSQFVNEVYSMGGSSTHALLIETLLSEGMNLRSVQE
jgi:hypothetical protein